MSDQDSIIQRKFLPVSLLLIGFPPRAQQFASRKPTCAGPTQILLFYYFTILLFYYFTILLILLGLREIGSLHLENPTLHVGPGLYYPEKFLPVSLLLIGFPPRAQQFASRKPTCAGPTQILLFYYFTNFTGIGNLHLENPPVPVGPRNCPFPDFARNPEKIPPSLFTVNRISSTGSTVCISKTHLCRSDPDFTILLFYYFTILLFYYFTILLILREIGSLHLENPPVPVGPRNYRFCISKTYLCMSDPKKVCISKTQPCMSDPQFACRTEGSPVLELSH